MATCISFASSSHDFSALARSIPARLGDWATATRQKWRSSGSDHTLPPMVTDVVPDVRVESGKVWMIMRQENKKYLCTRIYVEWEFFAL